MVHLYSAFNQGALHRLCIAFTHSHTHSYTDGRGNHARHQPAHREQLEVQSLAQGLFDIICWQTRDRNGNLLGSLHVQRQFLYPWATATPEMTLFLCNTSQNTLLPEYEWGWTLTWRLTPQMAQKRTTNSTDIHYACSHVCAIVSLWL